MKDVIRRLQREAERIASRRPIPEFYVRSKAPLALARKLFFSHPLVVLLREQIEPRLSDELGHGCYHCTHVSLDGAALIHMELESDPAEAVSTERFMILGLIAGLLHDISRSEPDHADVGSREAARILKDFPLSQEEVLCVSQAIRNHEAFIEPLPCAHPWSQLISDCLYDADKFRWGPDNFTHTLWRMVDHRGVSLPELIERFPWGISGIVRIRETFRTPTGRQYGPEIIEAGVAIGKELYRYLLQHCGDGCDEKRHDNGD